MTSTFIACDSINFNALCAERVGGGNIKSPKTTTTKNINNKKRKKEDTWCKFILRTGAFSGICGMQPKDLLPWLFVVGHSKAWVQSWKRLRNQTFWGCFFQQHLESISVAAMMSEGVMQKHIREWVPASILVLYLCSICTLGTWFCDQFAVSLATNAVLSRQD